jgi:excisionase family DNA binding protein
MQHEFPPGKVRRSPLSTGAAAKALGCHPTTVLRAIHAGELEAGELPAIRLASNALRIRESELEAFLERSALGQATGEVVRANEARRRAESSR